MGVGSMRRTLPIALIALLAVGCDFGKEEREATEAIYRANAEAAKQCEAKLRGLRRVPIAGTGGKLFLDAERLPMWQVSRGFRVGDECAVIGLQESEGFYWTGEKFIPQHVWVFRDGRSLVEAEQHKDWIRISADVFFGIAPDCKSAPTPRCAMNLPDKSTSDVIPLKNYPIDAWPEKHPDGKKRYRLALRDWPDEAGWPRMIDQTCEVNGLAPDQIRDLDFSGKSGVCQLDFVNFRFKNFWAHIGFPAKDLGRITPVLQAFQQYLNESIIEEAQP